MLLCIHPLGKPTIYVRAMYYIICTIFIIGIKFGRMWPLFLSVGTTVRVL